MKAKQTDFKKLEKAMIQSWALVKCSFRGFHRFNLFTGKCADCGIERKYANVNKKVKKDKSKHF